MARHTKLRTAIKRMRNDRETAKDLEAGAKEQQPKLITLMQELGIDNEQGIVVDSEDDEKGAAYVQHNNATSYWDEEAIMDWLEQPKRAKLLRKAQSTVFDINKFEAMVAAGEVPAKTAATFKKKGERPKPFIRFGKIKRTSL